MFKIVPHVSVSNAKKTIEVYKELFNAVLIDHMPFDPKIGKEMGLPDNFDYGNSTMHSVVDIKGAKFYIADSMGKPVSGGAVEMVLEIDSKEEIEEIWARVKSMNLTVVMELEKQFWGAIYGRFVDPDGIGWQLHHNPEPT